MPRLILLALGVVFFPAAALSVADFHDYSGYTHWNNSFHAAADDITSAVTCEILGTNYLASTGQVSGLTFYGLTGETVQELGNLPLPGTPQDVVFEGGFAYVVSQPNRLNKVVAFDPATPGVIWTDLVPGSPLDVEKFGQYLLIACGSDGLFVYDTTENFNLPVGVVGIWTGVADAVRVQGETAIVLTGSGITALDLSDPLLPVTRGSYTLTGPLCLTIDGPTAFVGQQSTPGTGGVVTELDFSDPDNITLARIFSSFDSPSVTALGTVDGMLVTSGHHDLKFIDLELGEVVWDGVGVSSPMAMTRLDDQLALACGWAGFHTFTLKSPGYPPTTEPFGIGETLKHLQIDGEFLFGHYGSQVYCFDLTQEVPTLAWSYPQGESTEYVLSLQAKDGRVYIGHLSGGVQILEYNRYGTTELVYFHPGGQQIIDLAMMDSALAVLFDPVDDMWIQRELHLYDLTDITSPVLLDTYANDDFPNLLAAGTTIALWDSSVNAHGIQMLDASDPENLTEAAHIATPPLARVTRNGEVLNIVAHPTMQMVDITSPYYAQFGTVQTIPDAYYFAAQGNSGYLANSDLVFDLSDPVSPVLVGSSTTTQFQSSAYVAVSDQYLVVGRGTQLVRMPLQGAAPSPVDSELMPLPAALQLNAVPNPFNPRVDLEFFLADPGRAEVDVFDLRGRRVARLGGRFEGTGQTTVTWDGRDLSGKDMPSGVYLVKVITPAGSASRKIVLAR